MYRFFLSFSLFLSVIIFQVETGKEGKERLHDDGMVGSSWVAASVLEDASGNSFVTRFFYSRRLSSS